MAAPLYLVRHGESEWNLIGLTQGQTHHPRLTPLGRRQAREAGRRMLIDLGARPAAAVRIVSSDLVRAVETAEVLASELGGEPEMDVRLREQHLGRLEGLPYADAVVAAEQHDWSDPDLPVCGGESVRQVQARMTDFLTTSPRDRVTVAVSHGDAIRAALASLDPDPDRPRPAPWVEVPNGSVVRLDGDVATWL